MRKKPDSRAVDSSENGEADLPPLPPGWTWATPLQLAAQETHALAIGPFGSNLKVSDYTDEGVPLVFVRNIRSADFDPATSRYVSAEKAATLKAHRTREGDILITKMGDPPGDACLYPTGCPPAIITADCIKFTPDLTMSEARYLLYAIRAGVVRDQIIRSAKGVAQQKTNLGQFCAIRIPVAPFHEQHRIVAAIEANLTRLDAGVANLKRVRAKLKRYRAAVLKAACEGRLVPTEAELARAEGRTYEPADRLLARILQARRERWEAEQLDRMQAQGRLSRNDRLKVSYKEPRSKTDRSELTLPEGWCWATVEQLGTPGEQTVLTGPFGSMLGRDDFLPTGIPLLTIGCLTNSGIVLDKAMYINNEKAGELGRYRVDHGDMLFSRSASVGRAGLVTHALAGSVINYHLMRLRLEPSAILPNFFLAYVRGSWVVEAYLREVNHGATRDGINTEDLLRMPLTLPPLAEQIRIIAEVERRLSLIDELDAAASANLKRADRLRQSILKRAFEGKLVPQDPADEPAAALLERIGRKGKPATLFDV